MTLLSEVISETSTEPTNMEVVEALIVIGIGITSLVGFIIIVYNFVKIWRGGY
jgi:hypothetical protein